MKMLIDTCVVIDFLQRREPFAKAALEIFRTVAKEKILGFISAKSVTDIYYITHRCTHSDKEARVKISKLLELVGVLDTASKDVINAISSEISDFEDGVMIETAIRADMDCIITRNIKDFTKSRVTVYTPEQFLKEIEI